MLDGVSRKHVIYLFVFGCAGSPLLRGLSSRGGGLSRCGAWLQGAGLQWLRPPGPGARGLQQPRTGQSLCVT